MKNYSYYQFESLHDASSLVKALQSRTGHLIGSPEFIAYQNGWVKKNQLIKNIDLKNPYDKSLAFSLS